MPNEFMKLLVLTLAIIVFWAAVATIVGLILGIKPRDWWGRFWH